MEGRILVVEDSPEMVMVLRHILRELYTMVIASNGIEALNILRQESFDLLISDVVMPEMDGFQLCEIVKGDINLSHIPLILLTAHNGADSKVMGLGMGADVYLEKPVTDDVLKAQVASLLSNRKRIREFFVRSPWAQLSSIAHSTEDERFLSALNDVLAAHMVNPQLDVDMLAAQLNMSRATLYRKVKGVADVSPLDFINIVRLKKAAGLLLKGEHTVAEISVMTGFNSLSSFYRNFLKQFGVTAAEYAKQGNG